MVGTAHAQRGNEKAGRCGPTRAGERSRGRGRGGGGGARGTRVLLPLHDPVERGGARSAKRRGRLRARDGLGAPGGRPPPDHGRSMGRGEGRGGRGKLGRRALHRVLRPAPEPRPRQRRGLVGPIAGAHPRLVREDLRAGVRRRRGAGGARTARPASRLFGAVLGHVRGRPVHGRGGPGPMAVRRRGHDTPRSVLFGRRRSLVQNHRLLLTNRYTASTTNSATNATTSADSTKATRAPQRGPGGSPAASSSGAPSPTPRSASVISLPHPAQTKLVRPIPYQSPVAPSRSVRSLHDRHARRTHPEASISLALSPPSDTVGTRCHLRPRKAP